MTAGTLLPPAKGRDPAQTNAAARRRGQAEIEIARPRGQVPPGPREQTVHESTPRSETTPRGELVPCCCHAGHLTERELDVLCEAAAGAATGEIAKTLGISSHTVTGHLRKMMRRTKARTRAELVARAYAAGILLPRTWPPRRSGRRCLQPPPPAPGTASRPARPRRSTQRSQPAPEPLPPVASLRDVRRRPDNRE